jgi:HEPN domain-containing protein
MNWQEWVEFAEDNWQAALKIREDNGLTTILLAHQVAEKYLKAVLVSNECLPERSHDLVLLLRSIEPVPDADLLKAARELNYYLPRARYPAPQQRPNAESVALVIDYASRLRAFARERLGLEP